MIDVMVDAGVDGDDIPTLEKIEEAVMAACRAAGAAGQEPELCIRFAADEEIRLLNRQWRDKDSVTDVLSFPLQQGSERNFALPLGDIALAMPFVVTESKRLGLPAGAHIRHLIIHATLHLLGFDHGHDQEAEEMQELERLAMRQLGLHDPYMDVKI